jgi:type IV pilus assembly protein PilY1
MKKCLQILLVVFILLVHLPSRGEDIDLFVGAPATTTNAPNVLIILDNTANWNQAFTNEKAALVSLFGGLPVDKFRVGLMLFTETGGWQFQHRRCLCSCSHTCNEQH